MTAFIGFPQDAHDFSAAEVGAALAGFIRRDSSGNPVAGVLGQTAGLLSAVASSWRVQVNPFVYVHVVSGGVQLSGVSQAEQLDITPAVGNIPSGEARIDRVVWDPDAAELAVIEGTPAASPSAPSSGGLPSLGTVRVNAGDGMVIGSRVTVDAVATSLVSNEPRIARGTVSKRTVNKGAVVNVNVSFPAGRFTSTPNVQATGWGDARDVSVHVDNITTSGCVIRLGSMSTIRRTLGAQWRAAQE